MRNTTSKPKSTKPQTNPSPKHHTPAPTSQLANPSRKQSAVQKPFAHIWWFLRQQQQRCCTHPRPAHPQSWPHRQVTRMQGGRTLPNNPPLVAPPHQDLPPHHPRLSPACLVVCAAPRGTGLWVRRAQRLIITAQTNRLNAYHTSQQATLFLTAKQPAKSCAVQQSLGAYASAPQQQQQPLPPPPPPSTSPDSTAPST